MTLTLSDEQAATLEAKAAAEGLSLEAWIGRLAEPQPTPQPATARPKRHISEIIRENMSRVPAEILAAMPTDGAGLRTLAPTASDWRNLHGTFREPAATATETIASARQEELDAEDARHAGG